MSATRTRCRKCNALNGAELFCRACDTYLLYDDATDVWVDRADGEAGEAGQAAPSVASEASRCPRPGCGAENPPGAVFCARCDGFLPWEPVLAPARSHREGADGSAPVTTAPVPNADDEPDPGGERVPVPAAVAPGPPIAVGGPIEWASPDLDGETGRQRCRREGCEGTSASTRWFCSTCGEPLRPTPAALAIAGRAATTVRRDPWWRRLQGRWSNRASLASPSPTAPISPPPAEPGAPAPAGGDRALLDVDRSKGAKAVDEALSPVIQARPLPPGPLDTVRAGLGKGRPGRVGVGFVAKILLSLAVIAGLLLVAEQGRERAARRLSYEMASRGIHPYRIYDPLIPGNAFGSTIAPGRSGRYATDGLATTYWADNPANVDHDEYEYPWLSFAFNRPTVARSSGATSRRRPAPVVIDQIGIAIGIQNGDFPYRANPRPKRISIVYGRGCKPAAEKSGRGGVYLPLRDQPTGTCRVEQVELADKPGFQRFRIPRMATYHATVYITALYQDVRSSTTSARGVTAGWVAITDVTFFERLSFERFDERERQARSASPSSS